MQYKSFWDDDLKIVRYHVEVGGDPASRIEFIGILITKTDRDKLPDFFCEVAKDYYLYDSENLKKIARRYRVKHYTIWIRDHGKIATCENVPEIYDAAWDEAVHLCTMLGDINGRSDD